LENKFDFKFNFNLIHILMSIREAIVNNIVEGISTKEPLYKFTYIMPEIEFGDDDQSDRIETITCSNIKSVIFNKSTYVENSLECNPDFIEHNWNEIIDKARHHHDISKFNLFLERCDRYVMLYKLSVELIN
jgi:hypothetical protein